MFRRARGEDGVVAVFVAILLPVMMAAAGFGLSTLIVTGGEREVQRATDAAATAAAASLPLADLTATTRAAATQRACDLVAANLADATLAAGFGAAGLPSCDDGRVVVEYHDELGDIRSLQDTLSSLPDSLDLELGFTTTLTICNDVTVLGQTLLACGDVTVASQSSAETVNLCTNAVVLGLTVQVCGDVTIPAHDVLPAWVDASDLVPALLTPRVRVTAMHTLTSPLGELIGEGFGENDVAASSLARRRFKNAVLLPVAECQDIEIDLQASVNDRRAALEVHCPLDANPYAAWVGDESFAAIDQVGTELAGLVPGGGPAANCLLGGLKQDLRDIYDPPGGGVAPTANTIIGAAAASNEDVLVVVAGVVGDLAVPILDMFAVPASDLLTGSLSNAVDWTEAQGVFRASLIDETADDAVLGCLGL